jgi:hypothetical protein
MKQFYYRKVRRGESAPSRFPVIYRKIGRPLYRKGGLPLYRGRLQLIEVHYGVGFRRDPAPAVVKAEFIAPFIRARKRNLRYAKFYIRNFLGKISNIKDFLELLEFYYQDLSKEARASFWRGSMNLMSFLLLYLII